MSPQKHPVSLIQSSSSSAWFPRFFLAVLCGTALCQGVVRAESSGYDWMPAEAESAGLQSTDTVVTALPLTVPKLPMPTADASKYTNVYTLELEKFGIRNNGTEAEATSLSLIHI